MALPRHDTSYDEFLKQLYPGVLCQFVVSPRGSSKCWDSSSRTTPTSGIASVMSPWSCIRGLHRRGLGIEAFMGLARYVYYGWDFRMIIMETVGIAFENFASGERAGYFTVEGRIRDQFYYGGRYWDGISVTHRRDQFEKALQGPVGKAPGSGSPRDGTTAEVVEVAPLGQIATETVPAPDLARTLGCPHVAQGPMPPRRRDTPRRASPGGLVRRSSRALRTPRPPRRAHRARRRPRCR